MKKNFDFVGHLKLFGVIALAVLLFGGIFNVIFGTKLDVAFKGGTLIRYSYEQQPDLAALESAAINRELNEGHMPYGQIVIGNNASRAVQEKLGMSFADKNVWWLEND